MARQDLWEDGPMDSYSEKISLRNLPPKLDSILGHAGECCSYT